MLELHIKESIDEVDADIWDTITKERLYISSGWLKTIEETVIDNVSPCYFVLKDDDEAVAIAVCYKSHKDNQFDLLNGLMFGKLEKIVGIFGISFKPAFLCGPMYGNGDHVVVKQAISRQQRKKYMTYLIKAIEIEAVKRKLSLFFTNVSETEAELREELVKRKYNVTAVHPKNRLKIKWSSYTNYLYDKNTITKKNRDTFKSNFNKNRKSGVNIRLLDNLEQEEYLYRLLSDHHYRLNQQSFPYTDKFLHSMKKNLNDDVMILVAERDDIILGVSLLLRQGSEGWAPFIGMLQGLPKNEFTYFILAYYGITHHAIELGIKSLNFGSMLYSVKKRRGCTLENSYIYHRSPSRLMHLLLSPWFMLHMLWYVKHKIPKMIEHR